MNHIVFLKRDDPAGAGEGLQLATGTTSYLPIKIVSEENDFNLLTEPDDSHSIIRLDVHDRNVLLSVYGEKEVLVASPSQQVFNMPFSTKLHRESLILRPNDQILADSGRWSFIWRTGESQLPLQQSSSYPKSNLTYQYTDIDQERILETTSGNLLPEIPARELKSAPDNDLQEPQQQKSVSDAARLMLPPYLPKHAQHIPDVTKSKLETNEVLDIGVHVFDESLKYSIDESERDAAGGTSTKSSLPQRILAEIRSPGRFYREEINIEVTLGHSVQSQEGQSLPESPEDRLQVAVNTTLDAVTARYTSEADSDSYLEDENENMKETTQENRDENIEPTGSMTPMFAKKRKRGTYAGRARISRTPEEAEVVAEPSDDENETITVTPVSRSSKKMKQSSRNGVHGTPTLRASPALSNKAGGARSSGFNAVIIVTPSRARSHSTASGSDIESYEGPAPRFIFTGETKFKNKKDIMRDFARLGGKEAKSIENATVLVMGSAGLKKTAKLIIAVARGLDIVTERWIAESRRKRKLLDTDVFLPRERKVEREWGTTLEDALIRGREGIAKQLLKDTTVHTTLDFEDEKIIEFHLIIKFMGGKIVQGSLPALKTRGEKIIIVGSVNDLQVAEADRLGHKIYSKDLIVMGALRGVIDTESGKFVIDVPIKSEDRFRVASTHQRQS